MSATAAPDPMAAARVLAEMRASGFEILASGDSLRVAPAESLTDSQRATLRTHKPALIALLTDAKASMLSGQCAGSYGTRALWRMVIQDKSRFAKSLGPGETDCTDCADCKSRPAIRRKFAVCAVCAVCTPQPREFRRKKL